MSTNYEVTAEREGKWWVFRIPALDTSGQARSLVEVEDEARGIISAWLEVPMESVTATVTVEGIGPVLAEWKAADDDDRRAREAAAAAAKRRRSVIVQLRTIGYTGADVAKVVGVSKQRVSQLERPKATSKG